MVLHYVLYSGFWSSILDLFPCHSVLLVLFLIVPVSRTLDLRFAWVAQKYFFSAVPGLIGHTRSSVFSCAGSLVVAYKLLVAASRI